MAETKHTDEAVKAAEKIDELYLIDLSKGDHPTKHEVAAIIDQEMGLPELKARIDRLEAEKAELVEACKLALSYLPAKDGKRTGEPDGDVQLMICNKLRAAIAKASPSPK